MKAMKVRPTARPLVATLRSPGPAPRRHGGSSSAISASSSSAARSGTERQQAKEQSLEQVKETNRRMELHDRLSLLPAHVSSKLMREHPLLAAARIDRRMPPLHEEVSAASRWPEGCDRPSCAELLELDYENGRGLAINLSAMGSADAFDERDFHSKRIQIRDPDQVNARFRWLASAPDGDVLFQPRDSVRYSPAVFQSFPNAHTATVPMPPPPPPLHKADAGGGAAAAPTVPYTHVAVGFVDLSSLAAAVDRPEWDEHVLQGRGGSSGGRRGGGDAGPGGAGAAVLLRWVGYEASPYAVAKALVLERMLRSGPDAAEHVVQVWFSSVWTQGAFAAFQQAVAELLAGTAAAPSSSSSSTTTTTSSGAVSDTILRYLQHWQQQPQMPLAESRRLWMKSRWRSFCLIGNFSDKADRLALCDYLLTGQLPEPPQQQQGTGADSDSAHRSSAGGALVGSAIMFSTPQDGPQRMLDESFLAALGPLELSAAGWGPAGGSGGGGPLDVVAAGAALVRRRVRRLACLLTSGRVEVQVRHCAVYPDDAATHAAVASLSPATISWSNIPDYHHPAAFHAMARACSAAQPSSTSVAAGATAPTAPAGAQPPTEHHMHSMNWVIEVKGASHMDALLPVVLPPGKGDPNVKRLVEQHILALVEEGKRAVTEERASLYGDECAAVPLLDPPIDNPRNIADFGLTVAYYQDWAREFCAAGGMQLGAPASTTTTAGTARVTVPPTYWLLARNNYTFSLAFTYGTGSTASRTSSTTSSGLGRAPPSMRTPPPPQPPPPPASPSAGAGPAQKRPWGSSLVRRPKK